MYIYGDLQYQRRNVFKGTVSHSQSLCEKNKGFCRICQAVRLKDSAARMILVSENEN